MREIITATAAETIANGSAVHIDATGEAYNATLPDRPATGMCIIGAASTESIQVTVSGRITAPIEGQAGLVVYLDNETPGGITWTKPSGDFQPIGLLSDGGMLIVNILYPYVNSAGGGLNQMAVSFFG